ncbi:unnamed protein product [Rotaria sp. Silwood2]|nr:unnamed protein product [Rotaria sp. Silwood2]
MMSKHIPQRQLDEDDIPPPGIERTEIPINHHHDESSTVLETSPTDNHILTEVETSHEHHLIQTETSLDQTNNSSIESESSSNDNRPLNKSGKADENYLPLAESIHDETNNSSIESQSNSTDNSRLNESKESDEDNQKINIIPAELIIDQVNNSSIELESNIIDNHTRTEVETSNESNHKTESYPIDLTNDEISTNVETNINEIPSVESAIYQTNYSSNKSESNLSDNLDVNESEKINENNIPQVESTFDQTNNSSIISESNSTDNDSPSIESEQGNEDYHKNDTHLVESTTLDQTNKNAIEPELNLSGNLDLNEPEKIHENDIPQVESTFDQTTNSSSKSESSSTDDDSPSIESEQGNEDYHENDTRLVESTTLDQTSKNAIEPELNLSGNLDLNESEKIHENDIPQVESAVNQINNSSLESELNSTNNYSLNEHEKVDENDIDKLESIYNQTNKSSTEAKSNSMDNYNVTEFEKVNEDYDKIDIHPVESKLDEKTNPSNESELNSTDNYSLNQFEKPTEDDYKKEETDIPLKSFSLSDVVSETLEEKSDDLIGERIQLENVLNEDNNINNDNQILDNILTTLIERSTDIEEKLDEKSNNLNKQQQQEEDESLLSNSKLISSEFEDILGNKTLLKKTTIKGELNSRPTRSTLATVSYKLSLVDNLTSNIRLIENVSNERFFISECDIISAIDISVQTMDRGECALIDSDTRHCYGDIGCLDKEIPPNSSNNSYRMIIELELHDWQSPSDVQKLSINERLYWGDKKRQMGNFHYRRQDYLTSLQCYNGAIRFLDTDMNPILISFNENQKSLLNDAFIQVENNVAQVNLLLKKYDACLNAVENVLKHDSKNVKALFRQGKAFFQLGLYDKAIQPLKLFLQIQRESSNSNADKEKVNEMILICENKLANYKKNEKEIYQRMFKPKTNKPQTNNTNQIENTNNSWWPYIALGSAVFATLAIVTFIKHRKTS